MNVPSPNTGKLEWVQIITTHISEHVRAWVNALVRAGATVDDGVGEMIEKKSIKIGVIIWLCSMAERQAAIDICEQQLADDVTLSVRYFMLADEGDTDIPEHHQVRIISLMNMAPNDFVARLNTSLYKARLPWFLRKSYTVQICDELLELGDVLERKDIRYRKIIIRSFKSTSEKQEIEYESLYLYIHNKELYEIRDGVVQKIPEDGFVTIRPGSQIEKQNSKFDGPMPLGSLKNNESDE